MKQEQKCMTKECFHFGFSFLRLGRLYRFSKLSSSLKHQQALDIIITNLKGNLLTMEISPSRNSTLILFILQLLYEMRMALLLEYEM